jgi:lysozyme
MIASVADLVTLHEGRKNLAYQDSRGIWSVGVGHNLQAKPLSDTAVDQIFQDDLRDAGNECIAIFGAAEFAALSAPRQAALVDAAFTLGQGGLSKFERMIAAIQIGQWDTAAAEMLSSTWATEAPERVKVDAKMLLTGKWPT